MDALLNKQSFIGLENSTWFYNGAEAPPLKGCNEALQDYMQHRSKGPAGRENNAIIEQSLKVNLAKIMSGSPEQIALLSNSSEIISMIAQSIDFQAGDNVVINTLEFPSGVLPWLLLKDKGVTIRLVEHHNWSVTAEDMLAQVDERTRLVIASHVSYLSGARLDYKKLYAALKNTNTLLLLDVTQSMGVVEVDIQHTDFLVCSSYKWLLALHGMGILGINPSRLAGFNPKAIGWRGVSDMFSSNRFEYSTFHTDARRFELGYPSYPTIYAMNYSTGVLLDIGIAKIEAHVLELGSHLISKLSALGYSIMTPSDPQQRAGNISIHTAIGDKFAEELAKDQVYLWGGDGRLRASIHLYNDSEDIERLVHFLAGRIDRTQPSTQKGGVS